jgi:hypothetical protein
LSDFDPWEILPCFYGGYSNDFDELAISVLTHLNNGTFEKENLASKMFRETLCTYGYCNYGSSPRVCFPEQFFKKRLPELIEKWKEWYLINWDEVANDR